jgi:hypothetical protein
MAARSAEFPCFRASGFFFGIGEGGSRASEDGAKGKTLSQLDDRLQRFIVENIASVAQLEVLLLLKQHPDRAWNAEDVARALYTGPTLIAAELADWAARGLLVAQSEQPGHYRYAPRSQELVETVNDLAEAYKERRVAVITSIYSKPVDKIRTFADAFRIRKEP